VWYLGHVGVAGMGARGVGGHVGHRVHGRIGASGQGHRHMGTQACEHSLAPQGMGLWAH
jgi:hypothetical protein